LKNDNQNNLISQTTTENTPNFENNLYNFSPIDFQEPNLQFICQNTNNAPEKSIQLRNDNRTYTSNIFYTDVCHIDNEGNFFSSTTGSVFNRVFQGNIKGNFNKGTIYLTGTFIPSEK